MAASAKTTNFEIPIYQLGDTVNFIPSYNNAMNIIDEQMQANKTAAAQNTAKVGTLETAVNNQANQIKEISNQLPNLQIWDNLAITGNTQNQVSVLMSAFITNNWLVLNGRFDKPIKSVAETTIKIALTNNYLIPYASINENIFKLTEGATNFRTITFPTLYTATSNQANYYSFPDALNAWVINNITYLGIACPLSDTRLFGAMWFPGIVIPINLLQSSQIISTQFI